MLSALHLREVASASGFKSSTWMFGSVASKLMKFVVFLFPSVCGVGQ